MSKRKDDAVLVLNLMLDGQTLTKRQLAKYTTDDSSRIFSFIRNDLLLPVKCDQVEGQSVWRMTSIEIDRYHNDRENQESEVRARLEKKRIERTAAWHIELQNGANAELYEEEIQHQINKSQR